MRQDILRSFDRVNTPPEALSRWRSVSGSLKSVSESENFVYRFLDPSGAERYLRLSHDSHRSAEGLAAELDFINYLAGNGLDVAKPIASTANNLIETIGTAQGDFHAVVFAAVRGETIQWGPDAQNRKYLFERGKTLGRLHRLSQAYRPPGLRRWEWYNDDLFTDPLKYLPETEVAARREYEDLIQWMLKRPRTPENYGMIHGDFGTVNTRRKPDGTMAIFDFDDCSYHWYLYDLAVALRAARKLPEEYLKPYVRTLLQGYAMEKSLNGEGPAEVARFCRLAALYRFVSTLRSIVDMNRIEPNQQRVLDARRKVLESPPAWY